MGFKNSFICGCCSSRNNKKKQHNRKASSAVSVASFSGTSKANGFVFYPTTGKRLHSLTPTETDHESQNDEIKSQQQQPVTMTSQSHESMIPGHNSAHGVPHMRSSRNAANSKDSILSTRRHRRKSYLNAVVEPDFSSTDNEECSSISPAGLRGHRNCDSRNTVANCSSTVDGKASRFYYDDSDDEPSDNNCEAPVRRAQSIPNYVECLLSGTISSQTPSANMDTTENKTQPDIFMTTHEDSCQNLHQSPPQNFQKRNNKSSQEFCAQLLRQLLSNNNVKQNNIDSSDDNNNNGRNNMNGSSYFCSYDVGVGISTSSEFSASRKTSAVIPWPHTTIV